MTKKNYQNFFDWGINENSSTNELKKIASLYDNIFLGNNKTKLMKFSFSYSKKLIKKLHPKLNKLTKQNLNFIQWEFILLHWCFHTVCHFYLIWKIVEKSKKKKFAVYKTNLQEVLVRPEDFKPSSEIVNYWVLRKILDFKKKNYKLDAKLEYKPVPLVPESLLRSGINKLFPLFNAFLSPKVLLIDTGLTFLNEILLNLKLYQRPVTFMTKHDKQKNYDSGLRESFKNKKSSKKRDFNIFFEQIFFDILPTEFVESFNYYYSFPNRQNWPNEKKVKLIITQSTSSSIKRIILSRYIGQKNKLFILQHGGGYGIARSHVGEMMESYFGKKFLTWGWKDKDKKNLPFFSLKLSQNKNQIEKNKQKKNIIFFISTYTSFFQKIGFWPSNNYQRLLQFNSIKKLINKLNNNVRKYLIVRYSRLGMERGGINFNKNFFGQKVVFDSCKIPSHKVLNRKTLTIHENINGTSWLETIAFNIPTMLLVDTKTQEVRSNFKKYFKVLKKNNIIFTDPFLLSKFLNNNFENIYDWWNSNKLQKVRNSIVKNYSNINKNPVSYMKKIIKDELSKNY